MKRKWLVWLLAGTMILSNSAVVMAVDEVYVENTDDVFGAGNDQDVYEADADDNVVVEEVFDEEIDELELTDEDIYEEINENTEPELIEAEVVMDDGLSEEESFDIFPVMSAGESSADGFEYNTKDDGTIEITGYTGNQKDVNIPEIIDGKRVTSIGAFAFSGCDLTSMVIPDSVTRIGLKAFYSCSSLTSVTIPDSATDIASYGFAYCSSLTSVIIPDGVTTIEYKTFLECSNLISVTIPDSVTYIAAHAFRGCGSLTSVVIPNGITTIEESVFEDCGSLTSVIIPNSITTIGDCAFRKCVSLTNVVMPNSVTSIGGNVFEDCRNIEIYFNGDCPVFHVASTFYNNNETFYNATVTAYYPIGNNTWNDDTKKDYGGVVTWVPYQIEEESTTTSTPAEQTHYLSNDSYGGTTVENTNEKIIQAAFKEYNTAIDNYVHLLNNTLASDLRTKGDVQDLKNIDQSKVTAAITIDPSASQKAISAAYDGLAELYDQMVLRKPSIEKINLSLSLIEIENQIVKMIRSSFTPYKFDITSNGFNVCVDAYSQWTSFAGEIRVSNSKNTYYFPFTSDIHATAGTMAEYLRILNQRTEEVLRDGIRAYLREVGRISYLTQIVKEDYIQAISNIYDYALDKGYGDLIKYSVHIYEGYEISKTIMSLSYASLEEKLSAPSELLTVIENMSFSDSSIKNKEIELALKKVEEKRKSIEDKLYNYIYHPTEDLDTERNWIDKLGDWFANGFKKITGHCPVKFVVYDMNGNVLGFAEDNYCEYVEGIYIEVYGDDKTIYIPENLQVRIEAIGTGDGEMNYTVEEYNNGLPCYRMNYYNIPLVEGNKYTQNLDAGSIINSISSLPLISDEGNTISANEILSSDDLGVRTVNVSVEGKGEIYGAGDYILGDAAELIAYAAEGYEFAGWYVNGILTEGTCVYKHIVKDNVSVEAVFEKQPSEQEIFCESVFNKKIGDDAFTLNAIASGDGQIYYYVEDEDILHISADGIVTLIHPGTTEIFIVATGSKNYNIATKTVTVNVNSDVPGIAHIIQIDEAVKPTCTEAGKTEGSHCSVCNTVLKPQTTIKALGHTWSTWKTTKVATALATGTQARTCSRCKKIETRTIAKLKPTIKLTTSTFTLQIKKSVVLTPFVTGLAKGDYISSWKSSNTTIAAVKNGKVIAAKKTGNAIITVRTKAGVSAKFKIKVQKGAVKTTSIKVNKL